MREEMLRAVLSDLNGSSADIIGSAVVSTDGLMIASLLPANLDEDRVGAMNAAMLTLGDRSASELGCGALEQVMVKGKEGYILMIHAGEDAVLSVVARPGAKLGLIFLDAKRAAESVSKLL
ncbi:MAG: roadblock/LC7 domain-containing protein [Pseudomonadota bacterium]|jgi:predicted regulator of Ras-like GTPase activity (Roadblock/LC7/MglB family)|uniref:roadblock/LC7 domain-containing protein n=1 Tax=Sulfuricystis TaxID=3050898 RepID=UPI000F82DBC1|nr:MULTISPECIES: roadblock/LC7 domain-containing protein [Sulfuricystis]MDI6750776.1 roadblock/LC7 domain-containing protein [Rhodocyclaceae bacterium]